MVAPEYLHLTGWEVPATFWGGIALTVALIALAAVIAFRGERKAKQAPPAVSPLCASALRDADFLDAIWRAFMGTWGERKKFWNTEDDPNGNADFAKFWEVCDQFRQKAFEGSLPVWATRRLSSLYEPLPLDFWVNRQIVHTFMMSPGQKETWVEYTHALRPGEMSGMKSAEWENFMTSKEVVDRLWPLPCSEGDSA